MIDSRSRLVHHRVAASSPDFVVERTYSSDPVFGDGSRAKLLIIITATMLPSNSTPPPRFSTVAVGDGPPLVVFPGLARSPATSRLPYLGLARITHRRVVVINRPSGLPRGITMQELARQHAEFIAESFPERIDLLGISTGGAIALQFAVDHPALLNRLVIAAAASWLGNEGRAKLRQYGEEVASGRSGARILASVIAPRGWSWPATFLLWCEHQLERRSSPDDMLATIDAEVGFDVTSQLGQIQVPSLLIAGGRDRAFPLELVEATADGIARSRLIVYPRAGHLGTMMNRRFGRDVAEFLATDLPTDMRCA
jgi:pimeloyl-ACP methyl ester carboxylesterase